MSAKTKAPSQIDAGMGADVDSGQPSHPKDTSARYPSQAAWRERNPKKYWAHVATKSALRRGLVVQQPCEICGDAKSEAHHDDYDRPLLIQWLCRKHHKAHHKAVKHGAS